MFIKDFAGSQMVKYHDVRIITLKLHSNNCYRYSLKATLL